MSNSLIGDENMYEFKEDNLSLDKYMNTVNNQYAEAHKRGFNERRHIEENIKKVLEEDYINYIKKLEEIYFKKNNEDTIFAKIKDGIQNNARGDKNYIYVIPTWQDFSGWNKWINIIEGINGYDDTHPEKCLDMFLNIMKNKGWLGRKGKNDYEICWSLVSSNNRLSGRSSPTPSKRIKFEWKNLSCVTPIL